MLNRYRQCRYLLSVHQLHQLPPDDGFEIAFAGRSNAGKSSAINCICDQKSLAKTSRTPGHTQAINYFSVDEQRHIVDLPGYGYARVANSTKKHWQKILTEYLTNRRALTALMLIIDIRHPLQPVDWMLLELTVKRALPVHLLLTKCDKLSRSQSNKQLYQIKADLERAGVDATLQLFSASQRIGVEDAHSVLDDWFQFALIHVE